MSSVTNWIHRAATKDHQWMIYTTGRLSVADTWRAGRPLVDTIYQDYIVLLFLFHPSKCISSIIDIYLNSWTAFTPAGLLGVTLQFVFILQANTCILQSYI